MKLKNTTFGVYQRTISKIETRQECEGMKFCKAVCDATNNDWIYCSPHYPIVHLCVYQRTHYHNPTRVTWSP